VEHAPPPLGLPTDTCRLWTLEDTYQSTLSDSCNIWRKMVQKKTLFVNRPSRSRHSAPYTVMKGAAMGSSAAQLRSRLGRIPLPATPAGEGEGLAAIMLTHRNLPVARRGSRAKARRQVRSGSRNPRPSRRSASPADRTAAQGIRVDTTCFLLSLISRLGRHGS